MRSLLIAVAVLLAPGWVCASPLSEVARANDLARVEPRRDAFANAAQVFVFSDAALYQIYATPGRITDLALQPGERLVEQGALAAGDTTRWIIADTVSGTGGEQRTHVLVKPVQPGLRTNLVISTDRRTYHLDLQSTSGPAIAVVRWRYPVDEVRAAAMHRATMAEEAARRSAEAASVTEPPTMNFNYRIVGRASWRPLRAYDDGRRTFIEFPPSIVQQDLPPLFLTGPGGALELVNYRVQGRRIVVDRLFDVAELRLVEGRRAVLVRVKRTGGER